MRISYFFMFCLWILPPTIAMDDFNANELAQEKTEAIIKKLGGKERCNKILAQWSSYEKRLLVTVLNEPKWPSHRIGAPLYFAKRKEIYKDRFTVFIENKKFTVAMADFRILAELHVIPIFDSWNEQMLKFDDLRQNHFETEDEVWEQLDRQLNRGK